MTDYILLILDNFCDNVHLIDSYLGHHRQLNFRSATKLCLFSLRLLLSITSNRMHKKRSLPFSTPLFTSLQIVFVLMRLKEVSFSEFLKLYKYSFVAEWKFNRLWCPTAVYNVFIMLIIAIVSIYIYIYICFFFNLCTHTLPFSSGVGATIGAGVYVLVGTVAREHAGPALTISFLIAGIAAALSAFCYAELACRCPSAGSA